MLSKETYESQLPNCKPGEELTITIESPSSTVKMTGTVAMGEDGGLEVPLEAETPAEDAAAGEETEAPAKKSKMSKAAVAAMGEGY